MPIGLYAVDAIIGLHAGDLVVIRPPETVARFLADGGYLPRGIPLLKHVAAVADKRSAAASPSTRSKWASRASATAATVRFRVWQGCRVIGQDEVFLMNRQSTASIVGRAIPL